jgi:hypothetical protein
MALTKEEAANREATVDHPALLMILKDVLGQFLVAAHEHKFQTPLQMTIRDADGDVLREFMIESTGASRQMRTDDTNKVFVLPLVLFCMDATGRVARLRISATQVIEHVEFLN